MGLSSFGIRMENLSGGCMSTDAQDIKDFEELEKVVLNNIKILRAFLNDPDPDPDFIEEVLEDMTIVSYLTEQDAPHRKAKRRALLKRLVKMVDDLEKEAGDTDIRELPEDGEEAEEGAEI
jgi:hypothetical protein